MYCLLYFPVILSILNPHAMITNILPRKLTSTYQKKKLVSLENCYMHLKPYFQVKKGVEIKETQKVLVDKKTRNQRVQNTFNAIEQNQILYAKILTEKLLKV